jgi:hypothetical protein
MTSIDPPKKGKKNWNQADSLKLVDAYQFAEMTKEGIQLFSLYLS